MSAVTMVFAFIGVACCGLAGVTVVAMIYHRIQEQKEGRNGK